MSIRAYRAEIVYDKTPTFNVWNNEKLVDFLHFSTPTENGGLVEVDIEDLKNAVKKAKELDLDQGTVEMLKNDIKHAEETNTNYIDYYCF